MQQGRDPAVEVLQLRRELKHLKSRYKALEGAFLALRQQGNGSHARMEAFLFRLRPARAQLEPPRSSFRKWVCRLLCLPELPEEERIWNNEGAWLLGVETESNSGTAYVFAV
ncbi:hypothetical protein BSKO_09570 [Bryopsis sp. KO-2023]|nr:hypothetical protein BSKO_09570 [Bryopsis sp. KO-2023]